MKEATGSLNMTLIVVVAIGAMASFFFGVFWPSIKNSFDRDTACNKANCEYGVNGNNVKDGYYISCSYSSSKSGEKPVSYDLDGKCPYKG